MYEGDFFEKVGRPIGLLIGETAIKRMIPLSSLKKLNELHGGKNCGQDLLGYQYSRIGLICFVLFIGGLFALVMGSEFRPSIEQPYRIDRPVYGGGDDTLKLNYLVGEDGRQTLGQIDVLITEQIPEEARITEVLLSKKTVLKEKLLAENEGEQNLTSDLVVDVQPFGNAIRVEYVSLTPEYLTNTGQLRRNLMAYDEVYAVAMEATLTYGTVSQVYVYTFNAIRRLPTVSEERSHISEMIVTEDDGVILPSLTEAGAYPIVWETAEEGISGIQVFLMSCLIGALLYLLKEYELTQEVQKRRDEILYDFPNVVNKLTILMNAGMTFNRAWFKIVEDYQKKGQRKRVLYEEMVQVSVDIQTGLSEVEAIEAFGKRCHCIEVIRMSSMLVQNLRRGSQSLTTALKDLRVEVWSIRTSNARKLGEKASTKLLIPMAISLLTVLLVVIAPTFMKMQL